MNNPAPPAFTISPYGQLDAPRRRSLVQPLLWFVAAVLAIVGPFLVVYDQELPGYASFGTVTDDGSVAREVLSTSGWGNIASTTGDPGADFGTSGPMYGIVFCAAAALMLITAIWLLSNARTRYLSPTAPGLIGSAVLVGSLATLIVFYYPEITSKELAEFHFRPGFYCELGAAVLGVIGGLGYRIGQFRADDPDRQAADALVP